MLLTVLPRPSSTPKPSRPAPKPRIVVPQVIAVDGSAIGIKNALIPVAVSSPPPIQTKIAPKRRLLDFAPVAELFKKLDLSPIDGPRFCI